GWALPSSAGATTISASAGSISGSTTLTVATLVSIAIAPASSSVALGLNRQFGATGTYSDGTTRDLTGTASWSSSAPGVATINNAGFATSITQGSTTIAASLGTIT